MEGKQLTLGQKIHLEGLVKGLAAGGREAVAILATHSVYDANEDIQAEYCKVESVFTSANPTWTAIPERPTLKSFLDTCYYTMPEDIKG